MSVLFFVLLGTISTAVIAKFMMEANNSLLEFTGVLMMIASGVFVVFLTATVWFYVAAGHKADMINAEFGTSYSREQVFFAESVIEEIRQIQRQRIELNGDLMQGK